MTDCLSHENSYELQEGESLKMASPSLSQHCITLTKLSKKEEESQTLVSSWLILQSCS